MSKFLLKPVHCVISVADMQESIDWYEKMLGLELLFREYIAPLESEVALLKMGDFGVKLFRHRNTIPSPLEKVEPQRDIQTQGLKHICYSVEDIFGIFNELSAKGAEIVSGPVPMPDGVTIGFIRDNSGNLIEMAQRNS
jgi:catechol 2,3-dioxygenase-like lactoylglutathione lyase family enzyme